MAKKAKIIFPARIFLPFLPILEASKFSQIISDGSLQNLTSVSFLNNSYP